MLAKSLKTENFTTKQITQEKNATWVQNTILDLSLESEANRMKTTQTLRAGCSKADPQTNTQTNRGDYNTLRS